MWFKNLQIYRITDWKITSTQLEEALSPRTRAIMVAHTLGNPFDLRAVKAFADKSSSVSLVR